MTDTSPRVGRNYILYILIILLNWKCDSAPDFTLSPQFNGTHFSCEIWNALPGEFGQEIGCSKFKGEDCIYYLTRDAEIVLYFLNGEKDSLRIPPSLKKRLGINPEEVIGFCLANDSYWFNTPMTDTVFELSADLTTIDPHYIDLGKLNADATIKRGLGLISCKRHLVHATKNQLFLPMIQHYTKPGSSDQIPTNYRTIGMFSQSSGALTLRKDFGSLPANYYSENMYFNTSSYSFKGDTVLVNYHFNDSIELYNKGVLINTIEMKSMKSSEFIGLKGPSLDIMAVKEHQVQHPRYIETVYDQYRNLYYRTFLVESKNKQGKIIPHEKWRLMVYDHKFRPIDEFEFKCADFSPVTLFVIKEGILIRDFRNFDRNNPQKAEFELLTWEEKEV